MASKIVKNAKRTLLLLAAKNHLASNLNPMLFDLILEDIFSYLDFKDLSVCRLVCKQWYKLSLRYWLKTHKCLQLTDDDEGNVTKSNTFLKRYLDTMHGDFYVYNEYEYSGLRIFSKFDITLSMTLDHSRVLAPFYQKCGLFVTNLAVQFMYPRSAIYVTTLLCKCTPNLKALKIGIANSYISTQLDEDKWILDFGDNQHHDQLESLEFNASNLNANFMPAKFWMDIYQRYPNLKKLHFAMDVKAGKENLTKMIEGAVIVRKDGSGLLKLNSLIVSNTPIHTVPHVDNGSLSSSSLQAKLIEANSISLETLGMCVSGHEINDITKILSSQAKTLRRLIIYGWESVLENFDAPKMSRVQILEINGPPLESLRFLAGFENLQTLLINDHRKGSTTPFGGISDDPTGSLVFKEIRKFHFCGSKSDNGFFTSLDIGKLGKYMPNIKDLKMCLTNDSFWEVCRAWPKLERLEILGNHISDGGITGVLPHGEIVEPNITSLTDLMSFTFSTEQFDDINFWQQRYHFTDTSIEKGLLKLPNLQSVHVPRRLSVSAAIYKQLEQRKIQNNISRIYYTQSE